MKIPSAILSVALLTGFASYPIKAETPGDRISSVAQQLSEIDSTWNALAATDKKLKQTEDDINFGLAAFRKQSASYSAQEKELEQKAARVTADLRAHDARSVDRKCASCVTAYNQEADNIDTRSAAVRSEANQLKNTRSLLEELRQTLTDKTVKWAAEKKENNARMQETAARHAQLYAQLQVLKASYEDCQRQLQNSNSSGEQIKHDCGNIQFDGASRSLGALNRFKPTFSITANN